MPKTPPVLSHGERNFRLKYGARALVAKKFGVSAGYITSAMRCEDIPLYDAAALKRLASVRAELVRYMEPPTTVDEAFPPLPKPLSRAEWLGRRAS